MIPTVPLKSELPPLVLFLAQGESPRYESRLYKTLMSQGPVKHIFWNKLQVVSFLENDQFLASL